MKHYEDEEQRLFFQYLALQYPAINEVTFHIPNGGKRNIREAARLKSQGVKAGVPDIFCAVPIDPFSGLFIEMKKKKTQGKGKPRLTPDQKRMMSTLMYRGYCCVLCHGYEEAIDTLKRYLASEIKLDAILDGETPD